MVEVVQMSLKEADRYAVIQQGVIGSQGVMGSGLSLSYFTRSLGSDLSSSHFKVFPSRYASSPSASRKIRGHATSLVDGKT